MGSIVAHRFDTNGWNRRTGATGVPNGRFADWQRLGSRRAWHLPPVPVCWAAPGCPPLGAARSLTGPPSSSHNSLTSRIARKAKHSGRGAITPERDIGNRRVHKIAPGVTCRVRPEREQCRRCSPPDPALLLSLALWCSATVRVAAGSAAQKTSEITTVAVLRVRRGEGAPTFTYSPPVDRNHGRPPGSASSDRRRQNARASGRAIAPLARFPLVALI